MLVDLSEAHNETRYCYSRINPSNFFAKCRSMRTAHRTSPILDLCDLGLQSCIQLSLLMPSATQSLPKADEVVCFVCDLPFKTAFSAAVRSSFHDYLYRPLRPRPLSLSELSRGPQALHAHYRLNSHPLAIYNYEV